MKCSVCGKENKEGVLFCARCGKALKEEPITLDLEQIKVPAASRKTHIIKVSAKAKEDTPESADITPDETGAVTGEENGEGDFINLISEPTEAEKPELPTAEKTCEPMRKRDWLPVFILSAIPVVNIIMLLIWSFSSKTNLSKKSFAQLSLIFLLIGAVVSVAGLVLYAALFHVNLSNFATVLPK